MRLAAIDIGTNSIHMVVVQVKADLSFEVVDREKEMVRLGAGGLGGRALAPAAVEAALETLARFKQLATSRQVEEILAVATSAVREARNGGEFLAAVEQRTGIRPRVVSGVEEARLIHMAAVYGVDASSGTTVVIDIGGGSMEVTLGTSTAVHLARSFPLGAIRLTDRYVSTDPLSRADGRRLVKHIRSEFGEFAQQLTAAGFSRVIATSGTSLSLGEVALAGRRLFDGNTIHHTRVPAKALHRARKQVVDLDMQRRLRLPGPRFAPRRSHRRRRDPARHRRAAARRQGDHALRPRAARGADPRLHRPQPEAHRRRRALPRHQAPQRRRTRRAVPLVPGPQRARGAPGALALRPDPRRAPGRRPGTRVARVRRAAARRRRAHRVRGPPQALVLPDSARRPPRVRARGGRSDRAHGAVPPPRPSEEVEALSVLAAP